MNKARTSVGNIVRIMKLVVRHIEEKGEQPNSGLPLMQRLVKRGFTPEDVSEALRWLALLGANVETEGMNCGHGPLSQDGRSSSGLRQLHISESIRLNQESQRLLLTLLETGKISPVQFEHVIQYIWQNDLRDVSPVRLEILLDMSNPEPLSSRHQKPMMLSEKLPPPAFLN
ncbi:MAG: DUF494 family protein [Candidatus Ozemobacteraceae bacterium]